MWDGAACVNADGLGDGEHRSVGQLVAGDAGRHPGARCPGLHMAAAPGSHHHDAFTRASGQVVLEDGQRRAFGGGRERLGSPGNVDDVGLVVDLDPAIVGDYEGAGSPVSVAVLHGGTGTEERCDRSQHRPQITPGVPAGVQDPPHAACRQDGSGGVHVGVPGIGVERGQGPGQRNAYVSIDPARWHLAEADRPLNRASATFGSRSLVCPSLRLALPRSSGRRGGRCPPSRSQRQPSPGSRDPELPQHLVPQVRRSRRTVTTSSR